MGKVDGVITPTDKTDLEGFAADATSKMPFLQTASTEERSNIVKMGTKNTGFVADIFAGVHAFSDEMPSSFDMAGFEKDMALKGQLPYVKQLFVSLVEKIDDTDLLLGNDLMNHALKGYALLKLAAKNNAAAKTMVDEIAEYFEGRGKVKSATVFSIAASSTITVANVVSERSLINNGITILKFKVGADLVSKFPLVSPITVDPGNSAMIPKGWTVLEVTNLSATAAGSFSVRLK